MKISEKSEKAQIYVFKFFDFVSLNLKFTIIKQLILIWEAESKRIFDIFTDKWLKYCTLFWLV